MQGTGPARSCPGCRVLRSRELALDAAPAGLGAGDDGCVLGEEEEEEEEEGAGLSVSVDAGEKDAWWLRVSCPQLASWRDAAA